VVLKGVVGEVGVSALRCGAAAAVVAVAGSLWTVVFKGVVGEVGGVM
jgi:hypothetical protein